MNFLKDRLFVGGKEVKIITKTGRLVRRRIRNAPASEPLGWRPAAPGEYIPKNQRAITDDFTANGAFISYAESRARLIGYDEEDQPLVRRLGQCGLSVIFSVAAFPVISVQGVLRLFG